MAAAKPKIDLKARLGRKSNAPPAGAGSVPPPGGAVPPPAGMAAAARPQPRPQSTPSLGPSIPPPPGFGPKPVQPKPSIAPAQPAPQAIKVEMSEEVVAAQKRGRSKVIILVAAAALIGIGAGFGVGQMAKGAEGAQAAVEGAEKLIKEIDESNVALTKLNDTLKSAAAKVRKNEFPNKEIEELGAIEIPFSGTNLVGKGIGRFNPTAVTMLLQYANAAQNATDQKDKVRRIFGAAKKPFDEAAEAKENPKVTFGVSVVGGPKGPWARVQGVTPFEVNKKDAKNYTWPDELEIGKDKKTKRYTKGEPSGEDLVPLDPAGVAAICPNTLQYKLMGALTDLGGQLSGSQTPGHEELGTIELGDKVMDQLRRIGGSR